MHIADLYFRVLKVCLVERMSIRKASRVFGVHRNAANKMLPSPAPPGYRSKSPPLRPKLESYTGVIDRILEDDQSVPKKQRHTAERIFDRLRKEHGFEGGYTIVKDYVGERRRVVREMFVALEHTHRATRSAASGNRGRSCDGSEGPWPGRLGGKSVFGAVERDMHIYACDVSAAIIVRNGRR